MKSCMSIPARYAMAVLAHLGFAVVYALRVNLSVALVAMVNSTYADAHSSARVDPECARDTGHTNVSSTSKDGEFMWDQNTQGVILGAFFYGYIVTQLPGGMLSAKFGGKWVLGLGVLSTSILTIITPFAARAGFGILVAVRILEGVGEGVTFPSMHALLSKWSPPLERSKLATMAYSGLATGTVLSLPLSGLLCDYGFAGGWPSVFYVFGGVGILWFVAWASLTHSTPDSHPRISKDELDYIHFSTRTTVSKGKNQIPWASILQSLPFWSIVVAHVCCNWLLYTALTSLPGYFKEVLNFNTKENGFLSALPFLLLFILQILSGYMADLLRSKGILSTGATRKLMNSLGFFLPAICLVTVSYMGCSELTSAVTLMTLAVGFQGFAQAGFMVSHLDIAPNFASILFGLTNTFATIPGCVAPSIVGAFTQNEPTRGQWQKVLFLSAGITAFGGLVFLTFSSGIEQSWNGGYNLIPDSDGASPSNTESSSKQRKLHDKV